MSIARADQGRALEREWWRRIPRVLWRPHEVFEALRGDSDEAADALREPMIAVVVLAGASMFLATTTAGRLYDSGNYDALLVAVETVLAGVLIGLQNYWLGGAALLLGLRGLGSDTRYRVARYVVGLSTTPFVLALLVVWPVQLAVFGGDLFRSGGADEGAGRDVFLGIDAAFGLWAVVLCVIGVRAVEGWSAARALGAGAVAAGLLVLVGVAAVLV